MQKEGYKFSVRGERRGTGSFLFSFFWNSVFAVFPACYCDYADSTIQTMRE